MRILFLAPTLPWPPDSGGRIRGYNLIRQLAGEHEIDLWVVGRSDSSPGDEGQLGRVVRELRTFQRSQIPGLRALSAPHQESWFHSAALEQALARTQPGEYDLIHLDELCLVRALPEDLPAPLVVHHHKLDRELAAATMSEGPRREVELERWLLLENLSVDRTPAHIFCSQDDAESFTSRHPRCRSAVVESGVDLDHFTPRMQTREGRHLLILGSLDYAPNTLGIEKFLGTCWADLRKHHTDLQLSIVGRGASSEDWKELPAGVELVGQVEDVRPWLARATALVVPLEVGGGTRLKLVEAASMGCPVVTTEIGASGLCFEGDEHDLRADSIRGLTAAILDALGSESARSRRALAAQTLVRGHYGWDRLASRMSSYWQSLAPPQT